MRPIMLKFKKNKTMKVTDLKENEVIHCETEEQANAICKLMHEAGLTWDTGCSYLNNTEFELYKSNTCYKPKLGLFSGLDFYKRTDQKIYKAEQFLKHKTMTRTRVLFEEVEEKRLKPIELVKSLYCDFSFSEKFIKKPKDFEDLFLVSRNYIQELDIIMAKKGNMETLYLGHWNDGIVE